MKASYFIRIVFVYMILLAGFQAQAANFNEGAKKCNECHDQEYNVWKNSPHFKTFKTMHKKKEAKKIVKATGSKSMKRSDDCV
ncbi:MAG: multiheme c-type cytochrome, partial [Desulfobulbia bacterium]